jgi:serine protease AprX
MAKVDVLVEVIAEQASAFTAFEATAAATSSERIAYAERLGKDLTGIGLEFTDVEPPIPMFSDDVVAGRVADPRGFSAFGDALVNADVPAASTVVPALVEEEQLEQLASRPTVRVWPNSRLTLIQGPVDCRPFRAAATIADVREALGINAMLAAGGGRGRGIAVAILDEGFDSTHYPVAGGFTLPGSQPPGAAPITSHGSMCAADVLVAAPEAELFDYPFLGIPTSGGALRMFQAVLDDRRRTGRPHVSNNSYGFVGIPPRAQFPNHEIFDLNHPLHRKVREVVASGVTVLFAAGNCGTPCPSGNCQPSGIGAGRSIHASNSLAEVITVAAINTAGTRIGYSSIGPGMFEPTKPDIACYSHLFGNFGPDRPGGTDDQPFDSGTSAATPVAAGVVAALLSGAPGLTPSAVKRALIDSTGNQKWNAELGFGALHAARAWEAVQAILV